MMKARLAALSLVSTLVFALPALAAEVEVQELNKGPTGIFVFSPEVVKVQPGDTVVFKATDKGHDVESVPGLIPDGASPFKSAMNQDLKVTLTAPGVYVFECKPHTPMGMVGAIVVGAPGNLDKLEAAALPGRAKQKLQTLVAQIKGVQTAAGK